VSDGIKIITEPSVYLVGSTGCSLLGIGEFLADNDMRGWDTDARGHGEIMTEIGGRLCYLSFKNPRPGGNKAYIDHILESGHGSVVEHATFNLIFTGVSRSLTHELIRHRAGMAYSELSQRFVDVSDCAFVVPPLLIQGKGEFEQHGHEWQYLDDGMRGRIAPYKVWLNACYESQRRYAAMVESLEEMIPASTDKTARRKQVREAARSVLPNCTETKIFVTTNGRAARHFLEMRGSLGADAEIRRLTLAVLPVLHNAAPNLFGDYEVKVSEDGIEYITTPYRKV